MSFAGILMEATNDFQIEKCEERDSDEIREISKANNYFNPEYNNKKETGFTGTVYSNETVKKILEKGFSFKLTFNGKILGYLLGIDENSYTEVYGETPGELYKSFFGKEGEFQGKIIYGCQAAVRQEFKGRGIARELFSCARVEWRNKSLDTFYGEIASHNIDSIRFWTHLGLQKIAEKKWPTGIYFKGCDEKWIKENYEKLQARKDKRIDERLLSQLKIFLYKFEI